MAPSFFSWLGKGTSRRGLPVTLSGGPRASCDGVIAIAGLEEVEEIYAEGPSLRGRKADAAFTIIKDQKVASPTLRVRTNLAMPARWRIW